MKKAVKKKPLKLRWPHFFGQRIHGSDSDSGRSGNMPELIRPESKWPKAESVIEDILRWADDGGKMLDLGNLTARLGTDDERKRDS